MTGPEESLPRVFEGTSRVAFRRVWTLDLRHKIKPGSKDDGESFWGKGTRSGIVGTTLEVKNKLNMITFRLQLKNSHYTRSQ